MALSEAGHLYKPGWIGSHLLRSKCSSVFAIAACWAGGGSDDEHPPSANSPSAAIAKIARFAFHFCFDPEFRSTIELPPIGFDSVSDIEVRRRAALEAARREGHTSYSPVPLLAASACAIFFAISAFTASRLKLAPRCIGGESRSGERRVGKE